MNDFVAGASRQIWHGRSYPDELARKSRPVLKEDYGAFSLALSLDFGSLDMCFFLCWILRSVSSLKEDKGEGRSQV